MRGLVVAVAVVVTIVLAIVALLAGGAPSAPSGTVSTALDPHVAQTLSVTLQSDVYSTLPPGTAGNPAPYFTYSAYQSSAAGGMTVLAYNQQVAAKAVSGSGGIYTLTATFTVTTAAICSGSGCASGVAMNLTVYATATNPTLLSTESSANATLVFSNYATYDSGPALASPSYASYGTAFWIPVTVAVIIWVLVLVMLLPSAITGLAFILSLLALLGEIVAWVFLR